MVIIDEVLVSDEIFSSHFKCNLTACKGACCWEGDFGAPLEEEEIKMIEKDLEAILPLLPELSQRVLNRASFYDYYAEIETKGTALHEDGSCVFLTKDELGRNRCGIELAHEEGFSSLHKPISCHLYPIRRIKNEEVGFDALNYDRWEICNPACKLGEKEEIRLYEFAKKALIRAYGIDFYQALLHYAGQEDE